MALNRIQSRTSANAGPRSVLHRARETIALVVVRTGIRNSMYTEIIGDKLRSSHKRSLSVVLLCFNDGAVIRKCVEQAFTVLEPITSQLQVIVIEDGSRDDSSDVLLR